jgi:hypothetical protein
MKDTSVERRAVSEGSAPIAAGDAHSLLYALLEETSSERWPEDSTYLNYRDFHIIVRFTLPT